MLGQACRQVGMQEGMLADRQADLLLFSLQKLLKD